MTQIKRLARWRHGLLLDVLVIVALALGFLATSPSAAAHAPQDLARAQSPAGGDSETLEYIKQGGMLSVLLTVLFFYRRDWKALTEGVKDANTELIDLVRENTKSQVSMEAATRENTIVTHRLTRLVEAVLSGGQYGRRALDPNQVNGPVGGGSIITPPGVG